jgi:triphosphoribosyl-dephospho-CoA synthase
MRYEGFNTGQLATLACTLDVTIPKPGNVHRGADFADTTMDDFLVSAIAIGPVMERANQRPLGETILECLLATRFHTGRNTNLGIVLLLAPLAATPVLDTDVVRFLLETTTADDCRNIYEAIRVARPGGLGEASEYDVQTHRAPDNIVTAMRAAADRDMVARQYTNGFAEVLEFVLPKIVEGLDRGLSFTDTVIEAFLATMHVFPDSLIARKCGLEVAGEAAARAGQITEYEAGSREWLTGLEDLDFWLRADGNRRNPGTTADLIVAAIFAGFRLGSFAQG